jgi:3-deoxy-D-manno-oct-2-ulosonic acid (Kdo) hydroxylase
MDTDTLERVDAVDWTGPFPDSVTIQATAALENGKLLFAPELRFELLNNERRFLSPECLDAKSKNVSYRPAAGSLQGTRCKGQDREDLLGILRRFYEQSRALVAVLCPVYGRHLIDGFTSFRPAEIAGRATSWRKDDTRLHVDAFPSRPMQGRRILRAFANVNPSAPRVWRVGEKFENMAATFLPRIKPPLPGVSWLLERARIVKGRRTLYDHYMLGLHDCMKSDDQYQATAPQMQLSIPAGASWFCFTDSVSHAAMSGQFALEQTFYLPVEGMQEPGRSPLRILERLTGRALL